MKQHDQPYLLHEIVMNLGAYAQSTDADTLEKCIAELAAIMSAMVSQEVVPLPEALGRFLARAVIAPISVPTSDLATGEGYAVSTDDLPVTIHSRRDGRRELRLMPKSGDELLSSLSHSHGLAEIPEQVSQVLAGDHVHFLPISMLSHG